MKTFAINGQAGCLPKGQCLGNISASHAPTFQCLIFEVLVICFWCLEICLDKEREHPRSLACLQSEYVMCSISSESLLIVIAVVEQLSGALGHHRLVPGELLDPEGSVEESIDHVPQHTTELLRSILKSNVHFGATRIQYVLRALI